MLETDLAGYVDDTIFGVPISHARGAKSGNKPALVHILDFDPDAKQRLTLWLRRARIASQTHENLGAFLEARSDAPGCLVIDPQPSVIQGCEPQAILLPIAIRCPIVVTTHLASVSAAVRALKGEAVGLLEKPLRELESMKAIFTAIEVDRRLRLIASWRAELRARFALLSTREQQVMLLVSTGKLNKQVGGHLGVSEITVKAHRGAAMRKMGASSLADLVRMADSIAQDPGITRPLLRNASSTPSQTGADGDRRIGYSPAHC